MWTLADIGRRCYFHWAASGWGVADCAILVVILCGRRVCFSISDVDFAPFYVALGWGGVLWENIGSVSCSREGIVGN